MLLNKLKQLLNEANIDKVTSPSDSNMSNLWSMFTKVMDFRKNFQNDFGLLLNPIKRQAKGIDSPELKKHLSAINKQVSELESTHKKYVEQLKNIEKNLFDIYSKNNQDMQYDYDNFDKGQDFDSGDSMYNITDME